MVGTITGHAPMTEERAREILDDMKMYVGWDEFESTDADDIVLDGHFTADQLEAIAFWMRMGK